MTPTPKEKADELIEKFHQAMYLNLGGGTVDYLNRARECALIAVYEIINEIEDSPLGSRIEYWNEVRKHIQQL